MAVNTHLATSVRQGVRLSSTGAASRRKDVALWIMQGVLAALFLFAGASKLVMPAETLTEGSDFPAWFLRFIGGAEFLGAIGLILPRLLRIRPALTPLAAAGLVVIMVGATAVTAFTIGVAPALGPLVIAVLLASIAVGRRPSFAGSRPA